MNNRTVPMDDYLDLFSYVKKLEDGFLEAVAAAHAFADERDAALEELADSEPFSEEGTWVQLPELPDVSCSGDYVGWTVYETENYGFENPTNEDIQEYMQPLLEEVAELVAIMLEACEPTT